jgi:hypothetical protein
VERGRVLSRLLPGRPAAEAIRRHHQRGIYRLSDSSGHTYSSDGLDTTKWRLHRNGRLLWQSSNDEVDARVPAGAATYRLEGTVTHTVPGSTLSRLTTTAWTFRSGQVAGRTPVVLPLSVVRFAPPVDRFNRARKGTTITVPIRVEHAASPPRARCDPSPSASRMTVARPGDRTVTRSGDAWSLRVTHPGIAGAVSLRTTYTRADGNSVTQTIYNAYLTH